jgi:hypothetical protein
MSAPQQYVIAAALGAGVQVAPCSRRGERAWSTALSSTLNFFDDSGADVRPSPSLSALEFSLSFGIETCRRAGRYGKLWIVRALDRWVSNTYVHERQWIAAIAKPICCEDRDCSQLEACYAENSEDMHCEDFRKPDARIARLRQ